jgi:hypothetical protein
MATDYRELARDGQPFAYQGLTFHELARQEYMGNNCVLAVGTVVGHQVDTNYLWLEKEEVDEPLIILLRPDELASLAWLASGALWSHLEAGLRADG